LYDIFSIFKTYYAKYPGLSMIFRVTTGMEIFKELSACLRLVVLANMKKDDKNDYQQSLIYIKELRSRIEVLKVYFLMAWDMALFSHEFYALLLERVEEVGRQAGAWQDKIKIIANG